MNRIAIFCVIFIVLLSAGLLAKTVEVSVSQVAVITPGDDEPDQTLGPRVCLKFSLPDAVQGKEIGYADLVVTIGQISMPGDLILIFEAFLLTSNWSEDVDWDDFSNPGGDLDSNYYAVCSIKSGISNELSVNISEIAKYWNSPTGYNYGLILIPRNTEFNSFRSFPYNAEQLRTMVSLKITIPGREE